MPRNGNSTAQWITILVAPRCAIVLVTLVEMLTAAAVILLLLGWIAIVWTPAPAIQPQQLYYYEVHGIILA